MNDLFYALITKFKLFNLLLKDPTFEIKEDYVPYIKGKQSDIYVKWRADLIPEEDFRETNSTDMVGYVSLKPVLSHDEIGALLNHCKTTRVMCPVPVLRTTQCDVHVAAIS